MVEDMSGDVEWRGQVMFLPWLQKKFFGQGEHGPPAKELVNDKPWDGAVREG